MMKAPIISTYTRAQGFADGALIDVSALAREAGVVYPVAITAALSADIDAIPAYLQGVASREGRLWDLVWLLYIAITRAPIDASQIAYELILPVGVDSVEGFEAVYPVIAVCGPGDDARPVITLMKLGED